jgi:hypothetical protein
MRTSLVRRLPAILALSGTITLLPLLPGCESLPIDTRAQTVVKQDYRNIEEIELLLLDYQFSGDRS